MLQPEPSSVQANPKAGLKSRWLVTAHVKAKPVLVSVWVLVCVLVECTDNHSLVRGHSKVPV